MILGLFQTLFSLIRFWHRTADIEGAHAELERHLAGAHGADSTGSEAADV